MYSIKTMKRAVVEALRESDCTNCVVTIIRYNGRYDMGLNYVDVKGAVANILPSRYFECASIRQNAALSRIY